MAPGDLGPGIRRLRPDDHFMALAETDATPMQIGALIYLAAAGGDALAHDVARGAGGL